MFDQGFTSASGGELLPLPSKQNTELNPTPDLPSKNSLVGNHSLHMGKHPLSYPDAPLMRNH